MRYTCNLMDSFGVYRPDYPTVGTRAYQRLPVRTVDFHFEEPRATLPQPTMWTMRWTNHRAQLTTTLLRYPDHQLSRRVHVVLLHAKETDVRMLFELVDIGCAL